jgi:hypothetical protein
VCALSFTANTVCWYCLSGLEQTDASLVYVIAGKDLLESFETRIFAIKQFEKVVGIAFIHTGEQI